MIHVVRCLISFEYCPFHLSIYIYTLLLFVVTNKKLFLLHSQIYDINTRYNNNLHLPLTGLTLVQKGVAYSGCKIYNHLHYKLKIFRIMYLYLSLNWRTFYYDMFFTVLTNSISKVIMIMIGKKKNVICKIFNHFLLYYYFIIKFKQCKTNVLN